MKGYSTKAKELAKKVPVKIWIIVGAAIALIILAAIIFAPKKEYTVLFTEMSDEDTAWVTSYLNENGVTDYRIEANNTILVPPGDEAQLKARILMENKLTTGFGYDSYYERVSALSTESERSRAFMLLLNDRLSAVVRCFDGVREAIVTINEGEDRRYVLDSDNAVEASASVFVELRNGQMLTDAQADAIRALVSRSVKGLNIDSVTITDGYGNTYSGTGLMDINDSSALKLKLEEQYANRTKTEVMNILADAFGGPENVRVGVNCEIDIDNKVTDSKRYYLPDWAADGSTNGEGIVNSKYWEDIVNRGENETAGGVVGTPTNSDLNTYVEESMTVDGSERYIKTSGQVDYQNDEDITHTEGVGGRLVDCSVSVTINSDTAGAVNVDNLRAHIARVAGIDDDVAAAKISIFVTPFPRSNDIGNQTPAEPGTVTMWAVYAALGGLVLFFILLTIILLVVKRRRKKRLERQLALQEEMRRKSAEELLASVAIPSQEQQPVGADVMELKTEKSMELRRDIRKFADENPEIAAQMIRAMLRGGEKDG